MCNAGELEAIVARANWQFVDILDMSQDLGREVIWRSDWSAAERLTNEGNLVTFNV